MKYSLIKDKFFHFFKKKKHKIFPSFPIYLKDDPSILFVNAGMNPFKDYFIGNKKPIYSRIANIQKCLRVTGKHNDLEQVGYDNYHHTMFEMMGSWSFNDYSREKIIKWAWNLIVNVYKIPINNIYVTVFNGDKKNNLSIDKETIKYWKNFINDNNILFFGKENNFWEMGEEGPCGPCTEIHVDIRSNKEKKTLSGKHLVNKGHPGLIEIWNIVFIEFFKKKNGILNVLPKKHIDTGMGLERLSMVLQEKQSSFKTDIFSPLIKIIKYSILEENKIGIIDDNIDKKVSINIIADHLRAIIFSIFDGEIPSNNKAGYIVRKLLRRIIVHINQFFNIKKPIIYKIANFFIEKMEKDYPGLEKKKEYTCDIIKSEEIQFFNIIKKGNKKIHHIIEKTIKNNKKIISGKDIFQLYDTYGYPIKLSKNLAKNNNLLINEKEFFEEFTKQKKKSKKIKNILNKKDKWIFVNDLKKKEKKSSFIGYSTLECIVEIIKYRIKTIIKNSEKKIFYEIVFDKTPFYPKGGGQVGDTGYIYNNSIKINILNTEKENFDIIHTVNKIPNNISGKFKAIVNKDRRNNIEKNHTSTHLLKFSLKKILDPYIEQKGSHIEDNYLRFDFSFNKKIENEKLFKIENFIQEIIFLNIPVKENVYSSIEEAIENTHNKKLENNEKYKENIRIITIGDYSELCIGTHVKNTGSIFLFKILSETSVSHGIRRIKAITSSKAIQYLKNINKEYINIKKILNTSKPVIKEIEELKNKNNNFKKKLTNIYIEEIKKLKEKCLSRVKYYKNIKYICELISIKNEEVIKGTFFSIKKEHKNLIIFIIFLIKNRIFIFMSIYKNILIKKNINIIKVYEDTINPYIKKERILDFIKKEDFFKIKYIIEKNEKKKIIFIKEVMKNYIIEHLI